MVFLFPRLIAIGVESWAGALEAALAVLRQRMRRRRLGLCRAAKVGLGAGVSLFWCVTAADAASGSISAVGPVGEATERGGHGGGEENPSCPPIQWAEWAYSRWSARLIPAPVLPKIGGPPDCGLSTLSIMRRYHEAYEECNGTALWSAGITGLCWASGFCDAETREPIPSTARRLLRHLAVSASLGVADNGLVCLAM